MKTRIARVVPVYDEKMRSLCVCKYPGHPKGCPNHGVRLTCPPMAKRWTSAIRPGWCWAIYTRFNFAKYIRMRRKQHPDWSERMLRNPLYWQNTVRAELRVKIEQFLERHPNYEAFEVPEAMGINVTETMKGIGVELEWPPRHYVYKVALLARRKRE